MILDDIKMHLENGGFGENLYIFDLPVNAPASCVVVRQYSGQKPLRTSGGVVAEFPRIQIEVRDPSGRAATEKAEAIKQYLDGTKDIVLNQTAYYWIEALGDPFLMGRDSMERPRVVCNYEIMKQRSVI